MIERRLTRRLLALLAVLAAALLAPSAASAAGGEGGVVAPWLRLGTATTPSYLKPGTSNSLVVSVANLGTAPLEASPGHPVIITDTLPEGWTTTGTTAAIKWPHLHEIDLHPPCTQSG